MKTIARTVVAAILSTMLPTAQAAAPTELCKVLRDFALSIPPGSEREFTFRTSWGRNFKNSPEQAIAARRCEHNDYEPAKNVCRYLMEHGSIEFTGVVVKQMVSCLSKQSRFDPSLTIHEADFSFSYDGKNGHALIDLTFREDSQVGGKALRLIANRY